MNSTTTKLRKFAEFTIDHPRFKTAVDGIIESITDMSEMDDSGAAMLIGGAGTGKSRVCSRILEIMGNAREVETDAGLTLMIPAFYVRVPPKATIIELERRMLDLLGTNITSRDKNTLFYSLTRRLAAHLVRIIILDEFQVLARKGAEKTREDMCNWVKELLNHTRIPIVLAGTPDFEDIVDCNEQLAQRYPYRFKLENFRYSFDPALSEWHKILAKLSAEMATLADLKSYVFLSDGDYSLATYCFTAGNMRRLRVLLHAVLKSCLRRDDHTITKEDFTLAAGRITFNRDYPPMPNPFTLTQAELIKTLDILERRTR